MNRGEKIKEKFLFLYAAWAFAWIIYLNDPDETFKKFLIYSGLIILGVRVLVNIIIDRICSEK